MGRVDVVLEKLLSLPDTSIQRLDEDHPPPDLSGPLPFGQSMDEDPPTAPHDPYSVWLGMEGNAEKLVGLAREFVDALDEEGGSGTLRQRASRFLSLTEANPSLNPPRNKAYQRIMEAFRQASPDTEVKRLKVSQLNKGTGSGSCSDKDIHRSDVEWYLAGAGALVWDPHRCCDYCRHLADITGDVEFASLANDTEDCLRIIDAFHLWGCFLLLASHDEVLPTADPRRNLSLRFVLKHWREPASALKEAAKDAFAVWQAEAKQPTAPSPATANGGHAWMRRCLRERDREAPLGRGNLDAFLQGAGRQTIEGARQEPKIRARSLRGRRLGEAN